jgi:diguanylate cyclase (GGDEF)-like protein
MLTSSEIHGGKILIVDDQKADVLLLERTLRAAGFVAVTSTTDPTQVRELHFKHRFDLILLDLQMPRMDGFEVMDDLKDLETEGYLPVLAVTVQPAHKVRALQGGAKDFISKPFDLDEVVTRVHNMLEVRLLHQAARKQGKLLESLALNDPLTGLANRRLLTDRMSMAMVHARRNKSAMAVVYLDLDGFKQINDTFGHGVGDALLKTAAGRMVAAVREEDTVARLGGDEFMILLWSVSGPEYALTVASRVIEAVSKPLGIEDHEVRVTTSAGIALYPFHGLNAESLMKSADLALYEAKRAGKNVCRISKLTSMAAGGSGLHDPSAFGAPAPDAAGR